MPTGQYKDPANVHCKQCDGDVTFPSLSELRKHQWSAHPKMFKTMGQSKKAKKAKAAREAKKLASTETALVPAVEVRKTVRQLKMGKLADQIDSGNGNMSALELLEKLQDQRTFMNDVVSLIENILKG